MHKQAAEEFQALHQQFGNSEARHNSIFILEIQAHKTFQTIVNMHNRKVRILDLKQKAEAKRQKLQSLNEQRKKNSKNIQNQQTIIKIPKFKLQQLKQTIKLLLQSHRQNQLALKQALQVNIRKIQRVSQKISTIVTDDAKNFIFKHGKNYTEFYNNPFAEQAFSNVIDINLLSEKINQLKIFSNALKTSYSKIKQNFKGAELLIPEQGAALLSSEPQNMDTTIINSQEVNRLRLEENQNELKINFKTAPTNNPPILSYDNKGKNDFAQGWQLAMTMDTGNFLRSNNQMSDKSHFLMYNQSIDGQKKQINDILNKKEAESARDILKKQLQKKDNQIEDYKKKYQNAINSLNQLRAKIDNYKRIISKLDKDGKYLVKKKN